MSRLIEFRGPPVDCCGSESYQAQFGEKHAAKRLRRYRTRGPDETTRLLLAALKREGVRPIWSAPVTLRFSRSSTLRGCVSPRPAVRSGRHGDSEFREVPAKKRLSYIHPSDRCCRLHPAAAGPRSSVSGRDVHLACCYLRASLCRAGESLESLARQPAHTRSSSRSRPRMRRTSAGAKLIVTSTTPAPTDQSNAS